MNSNLKKLLFIGGIIGAIVASLAVTAVNKLTEKGTV